MCRIVSAWAGGDRDLADEAVARAGWHLADVRDPRRWLITTALNVAKAEPRRRRVVVIGGASAAADHDGVGDSGNCLVSSWPRSSAGFRWASARHWCFGYFLFVGCRNGKAVYFSALVINGNETR